MTNRFQVAADRLGQRLQQSAGRDITFVRGAVTICLTAWASVHSFEVFEDQVLTLVKSHDFAFPAADLTHDGAAIVPRPGDEIRETINGSAVVYTVADVGNRPCHEWQDSAGVLMVVHTKKTG